MADLIKSLACLVHLLERSTSALTLGGQRADYTCTYCGTRQNLGRERDKTDVCVLAAVLGAMDLGYTVVLLSDAMRSGADGTQIAALVLLGDRFSVQLGCLYEGRVSVLCDPLTP